MTFIGREERQNEFEKNKKANYVSFFKLCYSVIIIANGDGCKRIDIGDFCVERHYSDGCNADGYETGRILCEH